MRRRRTLILPGMAALLMMTGCVEQEEAPYKELIVINVYDTQADYTGLQAGWYGKLLQEKFQMQLNFLDTEDPESLEHADLLICEGVKLASEELMENFSLLNLEKYLETDEADAEILDYREGIEAWNAELTEEGIYVVPSEMSRLSETTPSEENVPRYGLYLNWRAYEEAGMPDIHDMDDLLTVMEQIIEPGQQGLVLCNDETWDLLDHISYLMGTVGCEREGLVIWKKEGGEYEELLAEGSPYEETLLWLREVYQRGLLAPDSRDITYEELIEEYSQGKALLSIWPQLKVEGYELAPVEEMKVVSHGCAPSGNVDTYVAVKADLADPQRVVDFVSWLYSTEGIMVSGTGTDLKAAGPQGLTWDVTEGNPVLTEFGQQAFAEELVGESSVGDSVDDSQADYGLAERDFERDIAVPEEWGGGTWQEGSCQLSLQPVVSVEVSPSGFTYNYTMWETTIEKYSGTSLSWQEKMDSSNPMEYLMDNDLLWVIPEYVDTDCGENSEIVDKHVTCREVIVDYSWKIIFSETEEECESLFEEMYRAAESAGYHEVLRHSLAQD